MSDQVISFVADNAYANHAKSIMVNCRRQGGWTGDFCMISPDSFDTSDFERRGVNVLHIPGDKWDFTTKFWFYSPFFRRWKTMLATDLDIMVQGPLQKVFDELSQRLPKILMDLEDGSTIDGLKQWDPLAAEHETRYSELLDRFPHASKRMFNTAFALFSPESIPEDTMQRAIDIQNEFVDIDPSKADQMVLNLLLYDRMELAGKDYVCFFGCDYPENQIASEYRQWRGDEEPAILHYTRWFAPWVVKEICHSPEPNTEPGAYRNHRLGRICHELYAENLAAFDETFPVA